MKRKIKFIDLFAGAGGFGLGFQLAGYKPMLSIEIDKFACQTLSVNNNHKIVNASICDYTSKSKILSLIKETPDLIIGGPPCQGFSLAAGNRVNINDPRNSLFESYLNWVKVISPKAFIIENVPGILTKKNNDGVKVFHNIEKYASKIGYHLNVWKLNASNYGVPQSRNRVFIIGTKVQLDLSTPKQTHYSKIECLKDSSLVPYVTVGDAILDLPNIKAKEGAEVMDYCKSNDLSEYQKWARNRSDKVYNHVAMKHTKRLVERYKHIIRGEKDLPDELKVRKRNGGGELSTTKFNLNYRYLKPNQIAPTIPASFYSSFVHSNSPRNITTREAARLQSFPDWYKFQGSRTLVSSKLLKRIGKEDMIGLSQYNQVGNAVPPLLAKAVANQLKELFT